MKSVIYETKGRAREFNELAINLFTGCGHQCVYCYGANVTHQDRDSFERNVRPRVTVDEIVQSARAWRDKGETRRVLLCFVTDPYQPIEAETQLTRECIAALHSYNLNVHILTKGGKRSMRDFDLLTPADAYATTLTCWMEEDSLRWEPFAATPHERIKALQEAHSRGIETWVSLEPAIYPDDILNFIDECKNFVDHWKVGTMNYHPHGKTIDWYKFGWHIKDVMDHAGIKYYFKKDLLKEMRVEPGDFKQTWVCR